MSDRIIHLLFCDRARPRNETSANGVLRMLPVASARRLIQRATCLRVGKEILAIALVLMLGASHAVAGPPHQHKRIKEAIAAARQNLETGQKLDPTLPEPAIPDTIKSKLTGNTQELAKNFLEYGQKASEKRPDIISKPFTVAPGKIVRLDTRSPEELEKEGGWFIPNPDKHDYNPEDAITSHTNAGSGGSSNLVSASQDLEKNLALLNRDSPFFAPKDTLPDFWIDADGQQHPLSDNEKTKWKWYVNGAGQVNFTDEEWKWATETVQGIGWTRYQYTNADSLTVVASSVVPEENEVLAPLFKVGKYREIEITADVNREDILVGQRKTTVSDWKEMPSASPQNGNSAGASGKN